MRVGVVAPGENAGIGQVGREEVSEPMHAVGCPCPFAVAVKAVDGNNTWGSTSSVIELHTEIREAKHYSTTGSVPSTSTTRPCGRGGAGRLFAAAFGCGVEVEPSGSGRLLPSLSFSLKRERDMVGLEQRRT